MVGILIFIHHDILPAVLVIFQNFRMGFEKMNGFAKKIVKIECSRFVKFPLIKSIYLRSNFHPVIAVSFRKVKHILRVFKALFRMAYGAENGLRGKLLFFHIKRFKAFFHHPKAVIRIIYGKTFRKVDKFRITAKNSYAHAVEGGSKNFLRIKTEFRHKAVFEFISRFVGKSYGKNVPGAHSGFDKPCDPCDKYSCFSAARSCKNKERTFLMHNRLHLAGIERFV